MPIEFFMGWVLACYLVMSALAFVCYGIDKRRAARAQWRFRERNLHLIELLGGWPGALIAQRFFRHKLQNTRYMLVFFLIIALHAGVWMWYFLQ